MVFCYKTLLLPARPLQILALSFVEAIAPITDSEYFYSASHRFNKLNYAGCM
ncbi:MAG: hypothetical protein HC941_29050 [Microcoleus sp. SU_5_3]|nr:hypothetical protein [Microcoleus sp. SU_5_3]